MQHQFILDAAIALGEFPVWPDALREALLRVRTWRDGWPAADPEREKREVENALNLIAQAQAYANSFYGGKGDGLLGDMWIALNKAAAIARNGAYREEFDQARNLAWACLGRKAASSDAPGAGWLTGQQARAHLASLGLELSRQRVQVICSQQLSADCCETRWRFVRERLVKKSGLDMWAKTRKPGRPRNA
jgi:hypothetical protein